MELRSALAVLIAGTASIGLTPAVDAQTQVLDEGTFVVVKGGAPTLTETFRIVRNVDRSITATCQLSAGTHHTTSQLSTDSVGTPIGYKLDIVEHGAKVTELRALARGGRLSSMSSSNAGDE